MSYVNKISAAGSEYDIQDQRLVDLNATATELNKLQGYQGAIPTASDVAAKADAATTLGGYGITDAYTTTEADAATALAISGLNGSITGAAGADKTFTAFAETSGVVTATFGNIQIIESQVTDLTTHLAAKQPKVAVNGVLKCTDGEGTLAAATISDLTALGADYFTSAAEKATWNGKQDIIAATGAADTPVYFSAAGTASACTSNKFGYPVVTTAPTAGSFAWNTEYRLGSISALDFGTLPAPSDNCTQEIRVGFTAGAAITIAITAPSGYTLYGAGDVSISSGKYYEISIAVFGSGIMGIACKEWS